MNGNGLTVQMDKYFTIREKDLQRLEAQAERGKIADSLQAELTQARADAQQAEQQTQALQAELTQARADAQQAEQQTQALQAELTQARADAQQAEQQTQALQAELTQARADAQQAEQQTQALQAELTQARADAQQAEQQTQALQAELTQARADAQQAEQQTQAQQKTESIAPQIPTITAPNINDAPLMPSGDLINFQSTLKDAINKNEGVLENTHYALQGISELLAISADTYRFYKYHAAEIGADIERLNNIRSELQNITTYINQALTEINTTHATNLTLFTNTQTLLNEGRAESTNLQTRLQETKTAIDNIGDINTHIAELRNILQETQERGTNIREELNTEKEGILTELETQKNTTITEMQSALNERQTQALQEIETKKQEAITEIQDTESGGGGGLNEAQILGLINTYPITDSNYRRLRNGDNNRYESLEALRADLMQTFTTEGTAIQDIIAQKIANTPKLTITTPERINIDTYGTTTIAPECDEPYKMELIGEIPYEGSEENPTYHVTFNAETGEFTDVVGFGAEYTIKITAYDSFYKEEVEASTKVNIDNFRSNIIGWGK